MAVDLKEYQRLKQQADNALQASQRAAGAVQQILKQLETEYECNTLEEAEALLEQEELNAQRAEEAYTAAKTAYEEAWGELIDGTET